MVGTETTHSRCTHMLHEVAMYVKQIYRIYIKGHVYLPPPPPQGYKYILRAIPETCVFPYSRRYISYVTHI